MKRCPQCQTEYFDNMLDFCLEDGAKLLQVSPPGKELETIVSQMKQTKPFAPPPMAFSDRPQTINAVETNKRDALMDEANPLSTARTGKLKTTLTNQGYKFLEIAPIVLALMHNYWQWLYVEKQSFTPLTGFLLSVNFIVWFLLLISGIIFGIVSLKYGRSKSFPVTALVVICINVLLFLVPR